MLKKETPTRHDLSVGVGRRYAVKEAFGCGIRRRLGPTVFVEGACKEDDM